jgi:hypothetical protein
MSRKLYSSSFHSSYAYPTNAGSSHQSSFLQEFTTEPGKKYTVTFGITGHPYKENQTQELVVSAGDFKQTFISPPGKKSMGWKIETFTFSATSTLTTLKFECPDSNKSIYGAYLDNVSVVPDS